MPEDKTYQQMRNEFQKVFSEKLAPALEQYDGERKRNFVWACICSSFWALAGCFILIAAFFLSPESDSDKTNDIKFAIFLFCLSYATWYGIKKNFESKIKKKIMNTVCECFGNLKWETGVYKKIERFSLAHLIPAYDSKIYDDIFYGKYKDVNYEIIESEFIKKAGRYSSTVFKGIIVKLDMNKNFKGNTVIWPDTVMHTSPTSKLKHTVLEDTLFEKEYDVFTDDEVEARYLITPSFMERLNEMETAFTADKVSCAFYNKHFFVALHTKKDLFSICSLTKPVDDSYQYFQMFEEILSIIKLIDHFKLDQRIGL